MARYLTEADATDAGYTFEHLPERNLFGLLHDGALLGHAHYRLQGDTDIDFDSTVVDESLRGTGLSGLLATRALGDGVVEGRTVHASCWFIAGFVKRHPEALAPGATFAG